MTVQRPVNLDLMTLKFPPMAIASILHRISGVVIFLLLPFLLYGLSLSLSDEQSFSHWQVIMTTPYYKLIIWAFLSAFFYHLFAGFRHIIMDFGYGEHLCEARFTAISVIILAIVMTILIGIWIW